MLPTVTLPGATSSKIAARTCVHTSGRSCVQKRCGSDDETCPWDLALGGAGQQKGEQAGPAGVTPGVWLHPGAHAAL